MGRTSRSLGGNTVQGQDRTEPNRTEEHIIMFVIQPHKIYAAKTAAMVTDAVLGNVDQLYMDIESLAHFGVFRRRKTHLFGVFRPLKLG